MLSCGYMKPIIRLTCLLVALSAALLAAEPKGHSSREIKTPPVEEVKVIEYVGEDLKEVLKKLAAIAGLDPVIAPDVSGLLSLQLKDKKPREVITIIGRVHGLQVDELDGVLYVRPLRPEEKTARRIARAKRVLYEALIAERFTKEEALRIITSCSELNLPPMEK